MRHMAQKGYKNMAHSYDRTYLASLGFADPDKKLRKHDVACQFLASKEAIEYFRKQLLTPYGDSKFYVEPSQAVCKAVNFELMITKGEDKYKTTIGFLDYHMRWVIKQKRIYEGVEDESTDYLQIGVEVKITPVPVGDIIRQINLYREYAKDIRKWWVVTAFDISMMDLKMLATSNIKYLKLGNKFDHWCEQKEAEEPEFPDVDEL